MTVPSASAGRTSSKPGACTGPGDPGETGVHFRAHSVMTRSCHCGSLLAEIRAGLRVGYSRQAVPIAWLSLLLAGAGAAFSQCVPLTSVGYTQDFNTLANTGTSSTLPAGWALLEKGTSANTSYTAGTGSSNAGDTYSFGAAGQSDEGKS